MIDWLLLQFGGWNGVQTPLSDGVGISPCRIYQVLSLFLDAIEIDHGLECRLGDPHNIFIIDSSYPSMESLSLGVIGEYWLVSLGATSAPLLMKEGRCTGYVELLVYDWGPVCLSLHVYLILLDYDLFFRRGVRDESILRGLSPFSLLLLADIRDRE